jgi:hypothetical protein
MPHLQPSRTLSVSIDNEPGVVFAYVTDPHNLPSWAPGLALDVTPPGPGEREWTVRTADGPAQLRFVDDNPHGVADHWVRLGGAEVLNPMRVLANGDGAEVLFTLFQPEGVGPADFDRDRAAVQADLERLAQLLDRSEDAGPADA